MWEPNVYLKPDSNLITSPGIKTREDTAQHLGFLHLNLKRNQWFIRENSLLTIWICFHAECVLHSQEETLFLLLHQSTHGPCGGRVTASKLAGGRGLLDFLPRHMLRGQNLPILLGSVGAPCRIGQKVMHPKYIFPLNLTLIKLPMCFNLHLPSSVSSSAEARREKGGD